MKEVLSLLAFGLGALCFVLFVVDFRPNAISAVYGQRQQEYCNSGASPAHGCRPHVFTAGVAGYTSSIRCGLERFRRAACPT